MFVNEMGMYGCYLIKITLCFPFETFFFCHQKSAQCSIKLKKERNKKGISVI